jgi:hypothetical protein
MYVFANVLLVDGLIHRLGTCFYGPAKKSLGMLLGLTLGKSLGITLGLLLGESKSRWECC